jgi:hypothetical protein
VFWIFYCRGRTPREWLCNCHQLSSTTRCAPCPQKSKKLLTQVTARPIPMTLLPYPIPIWCKSTLTS